MVSLIWTWGSGPVLSVCSGIPILGSGCRWDSWTSTLGRDTVDERLVQSGLWFFLGESIQGVTPFLFLSSWGFRGLWFLEFLYVVATVFEGLDSGDSVGQ